MRSDMRPPRTRSLACRDWVRSAAYCAVQSERTECTVGQDLPISEHPAGSSDIPPLFSGLAAESSKKSGNEWLNSSIHTQRD